MKFNLVYCPNCEILGFQQPLGEVGTDGSFAILRRTHTTVVLGEVFNIACGACGEIVYKKEKQNSQINGTPLIFFKEEWVFGIAGTI